MNTFIIILTVIYLISVTFNQVAYYALGDTIFSPKKFITDAIMVSIVLTYVISGIGWIIELCCAAEGWNVFGMPLVWALLSTGVVMFFSGLGCLSQGGYAPGTILGALDILITCIAFTF